MSVTFREADEHDIAAVARMRSASTSEGGNQLLVDHAEYERRLAAWFVEHR